MDEPARDLAIAPVQPIGVAADLTPSWLQRALRAAGHDVTITRVEVEPVGTGQLSVSLRARFDVAAPVSGLPQTVVVKIPSADEGLRSFLRRAYLSEVGFYRDYRLDNLLFSPDGRVCAVDWQTLAVGLPARDVAYVIGTSLSTADRRVAEEDLVRGYWEELLRRGVAGYGLEECFDDYRLGMLQCPFISVLGMAYGAPTDRGDAMFAAMIARSCQAIRDLGSVARVAAGALPRSHGFSGGLPSAPPRCWSSRASARTARSKSGR